MKLSSLTEQDKIRMAAELDGWTYKRASGPYSSDGWWSPGNRGPFSERQMGFDNGFRRIPTSYDAIIPLVQKQEKGVQLDLWDRCSMFNFTPLQLLDALLVATGKAEV